MKIEKTDRKIEEKEKIAGAKLCRNRECHIHGHLKVHGRTFEGTVTKKFQRRVVVEFERAVYVRKYERYAKSKTKIHARLPECMEDEIKVGDLIKVKECRPLSKIIHFAVIGKIKDKKEIGWKRKNNEN